MSRTPARTRHRVDVAPLMLGLLMLPLSLLALWISFGLQVAWGDLAVAAPVGLITLGVLGLVLSRNSS
ncbi:hypothetical protein GC722_10105 [Auraticoccus sp. F435]|uniref:DUF4175 domain-containing protein n=1 Tax=Auraticoccus cholistanensis TaxID=2656650 RepID=A0A6A9UU76_9ACTN|nr:hypothetical protein [Auraticoccus cholistanensis]MVA76373.1 hypothetical protein [Auraticoccus cholistanensis]